MASPEVRYRLIGPWGHFRLYAEDDVGAAAEAHKRMGPFFRVYGRQPHHKPVRLIRVTQEEIPL